MSEDKFKNHFRIQSTRLPGYDYRRAGKYFVTICVKGREQILGCVKEDKMILSPPGKIVNSCWLKIGALHDYIHLDEYVIMPDHVHGIIEILDRPGGIDNSISIENMISNKITVADENADCIDNSIFLVETLQCNVSTIANDLNDLTQPQDTNEMPESLVTPVNPERTKYFSNLSPKPKSLSTIIRTFKGACSKEIKMKLGIKMEWQERFYDRRIRSREELEAIQWYIRNNPRNWVKKWRG